MAYLFDAFDWKDWTTYGKAGQPVYVRFTDSSKNRIYGEKNIVVYGSASKDIWDAAIYG